MGGPKGGGPRGAPKGGAPKGGAPKGGAPKGGGSQGFEGWGAQLRKKWWFEGWGVEGWGPRRVEAQNFALFFSLSRRKICSFLPSLGVFYFGGVFEAPGRSNVHVWALGLSCVTGGPGTFDGSGLQKKFNQTPYDTSWRFLGRNQKEKEGPRLNNS